MAGNLAGSFSEFSADSSLPNANSRRDSSALHANSQILNPAGAGNLFRRGQGISSTGAGNSLLKSVSWNLRVQLTFLEFALGAWSSYFPAQNSIKLTRRRRNELLIEFEHARKRPPKFLYETYGVSAKA
jgi:hypothetical protein